MATRQGGNFAKNASICDRRSDLRTTTWPVASKTLLAKSRPIVVIFMADGSLFARERQTAFTLWHPDAVSGSHPPHLLCADCSLMGGGAIGQRAVDDIAVA